MNRSVFSALLRHSSTRPMIALIVLCSLGHAQESASSASKSMHSEKSGAFTFTLLPKSFQKNPVLDMTANTELSDYGRLLRPASPEAPVYYFAYAGGFKQMGSPVGGEKPPLPKDMEFAMKNALAVNGYRAADSFPGHNPSLIVFFSWGSHNRLDPETARSFPELAAKDRLERAVLVGGKKYLAERSFAMEWGDLTYQTTDKEYLNYQAAESLYFVIASAYDYAALAGGERKLAWRTTLTVNSRGVSLRETLPPLIANSATVFGKETASPQIIQRRVHEGRVELGTPIVVEPTENKTGAPKP